MVDRRRGKPAWSAAQATVSAQVLEAALTTIEKHPGVSARTLGLGPRTIATLAYEGRIRRHGKGWAISSPAAE